MIAMTMTAPVNGPSVNLQANSPPCQAIKEPDHSTRFRASPAYSHPLPIRISSILSPDPRGQHVIHGLAFLRLLACHCHTTKQEQLDSRTARDMYCSTCNVMTMTASSSPSSGSPTSAVPSPQDLRGMPPPYPDAGGGRQCPLTAPNPVSLHQQAVLWLRARDKCSRDHRELR